MRPLLEASGQALIVLDEEDAVVFATSTALGLLGTRADALEQQPLRDHATISAPGLPLLVQACDGLQHVALEAHDGRRFVARLRVLSDRRAVATHVSLTLDAPRAVATQAPSLEALGRLAAELGHEINNQLAAALNYASIVQRRVGSGDGLVEREHLEELQQALWRASGWTASLRLVGRQRSATPERLSADQVLVELEPLLRHVLGETTLHFDLDAARSRIEVPRAYFEQIVIGMLAHALSRASSPKAITVRTRVLNGGEARSPLVRLTCEAHGEHISNTSLAAQRGTARPRSTLRRALKRCNATLNHDQHEIWADFGL
jgi:C4-dicarboxylate-specific signal transduction histidine kinase